MLEASCGLYENALRDNIQSLFCLQHFCNSAQFAERLFSLLIKFLRCLRKLGPFNEGGDREESCLAPKDRTLKGREKEERVLHPYYSVQGKVHQWPSHFHFLRKQRVS